MGMNTLALRAILAGFLLTTATVKVLRADPDVSDIHSTVMDLASRAHLSPRDLAKEEAAPFDRVIAFQADGCAGPGRIYFADLGLQLGPMLDRDTGPAQTMSIAYLGRTWTTQDRLGLRLEWLKQKTLRAFGLSPFIVNEDVLVISEPRGCHAADTIDWSAAWRQANGP